MVIVCVAYICGHCRMRPDVTAPYEADAMMLFYEEFFKHDCPAEALRKAQSCMLQSQETRHPRFWAGFLVYGTSTVAAQSLADGFAENRCTFVRQSQGI